MARPVVWTLTPDRAAEWRRIRLRALRGDPQAFCSLYQDWAHRPLPDFATRLAAGHVLAAGRKPGLPLAVAALDRSDDPGCGRVTSVYCLPAARGRGFADALLARLITDARAADLRELRFDVVADNMPAIRFYQRLGFADTGRKGLVTPSGLPEIEMALPLAI